MASTSNSSSTAEAPWKSLFTSHLESMGSGPEFYLATVTAKGIPKTRACIHRGFFASPLPDNPHRKYPSNPHVFDSDCPTFTTDARMSKVYDIFASGPGKGSLEQSRSGTGGGGYVEACYWAKEKMMQWRITGKCWLIAADDVEAEGAGDPQNSGTVTTKGQLRRYFRPATNNREGDKKDWSWKREVESQFANLSPGMRGSFKNPPPGEAKEDGNKGKGEELGQKAEEDLDQEPLASKNFRVAVIAPEIVEVVDLNDPAKSYRRRWTLSPEAKPGDEESPLGEWKEELLWP